LQETASFQILGSVKSIEDRHFLFDFIIICSNVTSTVPM